MHRRVAILSGALIASAAVLLVVQEESLKAVFQEPPAIGSGSGLAADPVRLTIPKLRIDAPVLRVGLTSQGYMDIPRGAFEIGWFERGTRPGNRGNAVFAGHLDTTLGTPGAFAHLSDLRPGDIVEVQDTGNVTRRFKVVRQEIYDQANAPMQEIFGPSDRSRLQLITCDGVWLKDKRIYSQRLVVYTELVSGTTNAEEK
jgi:LPXTG-site transpeptidase (sortase) family protein